MSKITLKSYYAVILSVGYGVYDSWDKVESIQKRGFHKKGSHFFHTRKFTTYYDAAQYALQIATDRCKVENILVSNLVIPVVPNQIIFYSRTDYLNPEEVICLYQMLESYQSERNITSSTKSDPINLVEFADGLTDCQ